MNPSWDDLCEGIPMKEESVEEFFGAFWSKDHDEDRTWFIQRILGLSL